MKVERDENGINAHYPLKHNTNTVYVNPGQVLSIELDDAYFPELPEDWRGKGKKLPEETRSGRLEYPEQPFVSDGIGNRELLIYANIYKDGRLLKHSVISDLVQHVTTAEFATVTNPRFFTETIDSGYYQILIKVHEVNTTGAVRVLRRADQLEYSELEATYNFGEAFTMGVGDVVKGAIGITTSITGRPLDSLIAQAKSVPIMEHSIYIVPTVRKKKSCLDSTSKLVIMANSNLDSFLVRNKIQPSDEGNGTRVSGYYCEKMQTASTRDIPNVEYDRMMHHLKKAGEEMEPENISELLYQHAYGNPFMVFSTIIHDDGATTKDETKDAGSQQKQIQRAENG